MEVVVRSRSLVLTLALVLIGGFPAHSAYAARTTADDEAEEPFQGRTVQYYRPEACKKCHEEIYNQWKSSMHAKSTALKDPIHEAMYQMEVGSPTEEGVKHKKSQTYPVCLQCHAPVAAMEKKTKLDEKEAYSNGVGCVVCHSFAHFKGIKKPDGKYQLGQLAYQVDTEQLYGPSGISYTKKRVPKGSTWPIPVNHPQPIKGSKASLFKSNDLCMGCHDQRNNPKEVPLCMTGPEYEKGKAFINCQACHMAPTEVVNKDGEKVKVFDHTMAGGHHDKMITQGVALSMDVKREGDNFKVDITLRNRLPHAYPTGAPFRNAIVRVAAYDKDGKLLWQNYEKHPSKDDPKAFLLLALGKDGKPVMPPEATEILNDSRLQPDETRALEYSFTAAGVGIVRTELLYHLLTPPVLEMFGDKLPEDVKKAKVAASAEERFEG